jgi:hypothetical protein
MNASNIDEFSKLIRKIRALWRVADLDEREWFESLEELDLAEIRTALNTWCKDPEKRKYPPRPIDIIGACADANVKALGWPGAEEAWTIACQAMDERSTVVWCQEIASSWGQVKPVLDAGDEVGARMAFREIYTKIMRSALDEGRKPKWLKSLGHDVEQRTPALEIAAKVRQIPGIAAIAQLYGPPAEPAENIRAKLAAIRANLVTSSMPEEGKTTLLKIIAELPEDRKQQHEAIEKLDKMTAERIRHELGELEKVRQRQLVAEVV